MVLKAGVARARYYCLHELEAKVPISWPIMLYRRTFDSLTSPMGPTATGHEECAERTKDNDDDK